MILATTGLIGGLLLLAWSADRFVFGAAATARNLGVSPLVIGLTVVGFGTSAPELLVSAVAAWQDRPGLALGNAVGSNIANIGLVLGCAALVAPLTIRSSILHREYPVMVLTLLAAYAVLWDGELARYEGAGLLGGLAALIAWTAWTGLRGRADHQPADPLELEYRRELPPAVSTLRALTWLLAGLILLLLSSRLLVWAAVELARHFGVSEVVIGLTVVAIGTSLPEVATSVAGSLKGEHDIAVGNVVGSNMFNVLGVIGVAGVLAPVGVDPALLIRDFPLMLGLTGMLLVMAWRPRGTARIQRWQGALLLAVYLAYLAYLAWPGAAGSAPAAA